MTITRPPPGQYKKEGVRATIEGSEIEFEPQKPPTTIIDFLGAVPWRVSPIPKELSKWFTKYIHPK